MANLAAGTQAGGLWVQRVCNPLVHGFRRRTSSFSGVQLRWAHRLQACVPRAIQRRLKYCTAFSCFFAAARVLNVPRFLRLPVFGFFFREYKR
jgi:hypothetical protein